MSCNPAIGGLAKGQIAREVDALGGVMGKVTDRTAIQFRLLNRRKGPAVQGPRAQCDKKAYQFAVKETIEGISNIEVRQEMVTDIAVEEGSVSGVVCGTGTRYASRTVILAPGTFMGAVIHVGEDVMPGGRGGELAATAISESLRRLGFPVCRLKTGTPARISALSIDYSKLQPQYGDEDPVPFSFSTDKVETEQVPCHIAFTNPRTHEIIRRNLHRAPLYTGQIQSVGPRYCPSIETKIVRFEDKERHQLFLEPEGIATREVYVNGASTSLPRDVQEEMLRSVEGLENCRIMRYGYAVEYDFIPPTEVFSTLETKRVKGLFFAGQINGTSGYEEAAGQGLMAGVNATLRARGEEGVTLGRHEAYIGVLVDDLVTKGVDEPYRMFTSRAEYRLLLRHDNADRRLTPLARKLGLVDDAVWGRFTAKCDEIKAIREFLAATHRAGESLEQFVKRPEVEIGEVAKEYPELRRYGKSALDAAATDIKYAGYIAREEVKVEKMRKSESERLPGNTDYDAMKELRFEAQEKLKLHRPVTLGQASRIPGVNPADITILMLYLRRGVPVSHWGQYTIADSATS
jgi:tRNA uridine 5-carboxymethylaminomethyl modification enzyme